MVEHKHSAAPINCQTCTVRMSCFGHGADAAALEKLNRAVERRIRLESGDYLYRTGDPFTSLYAVSTGCLRNTIRDDRGREQVMGFHMMGDVLGVAGIGPRHYIFDMRAVQASEVCEVPFDRLEELAEHVPGLRGNILKIFGRYRNRDARTLALRRSANPDVRLAGFLLDLSQRREMLEQDAAVIDLPMSRADIASYLGLSTGVLARSFLRLDERGIAKTARKSVQVRDAQGLKTLAAASL